MEDSNKRIDVNRIVSEGDGQFRLALVIRPMIDSVLSDKVTLKYDNQVPERYINVLPADKVTHLKEEDLQPNRKLTIGEYVNDNGVTVLVVRAGIAKLVGE